jgi:hypothetical protein
MLKQSYQCEQYVRQQDSFNNFLDLMYMFMDKFTSLIKENYSASISNIKNLREKELNRYYTCNSCVHRYKYQISRICNEVYSYDSKGYSNNEEENNFYS